MRLALTIIVSALCGATGVFWYEHGVCERPCAVAVPIATKGAKPIISGRLHIFQKDGSTYIEDLTCFLAIRQPDGTDLTKSARIHLQVGDVIGSASQLAQTGDATFVNVTGFVTDDARDEQ